MPALALMALLALQSPATNFVTAAAYSSAHSGDALAVFRHDSLVFEDYQPGSAHNLPHPLASGTKTFSCVIAAAAAADGLLTLDEPVSRTFPEFARDAGLQTVTIRHLLSLTSGLDMDRSGRLTTVSRPGRKFAYGGTSFALFGAVMARKLDGQDLITWLSRRVLDPIGMTIGEWERDGDGHPGLASGAAFTARNWGKFGLLLLDHGRWHGKQLIPAAAIAECGKGSSANPYYGLGVWLNAAPGAPPPPKGVERAGKTDHLIDAPDLPHDLWLSAGTGGQRLYILPSAGLVVVRFGHNTGPDYRDDEFLRILLGH